jgi:chaperone required for assembly of F1-ATPase
VSRARRRAGFLSPEDAWRAAHLDEDFQAERWGTDAEALARRVAG